MDAERFDDLSRIFALGTRRRDLLRGIATGVVASAAAYLLGRPIPEARAREGDPCDQIAVEECIRKAVDDMHQGVVGCISYFCSDGVLGRLDCACYGEKFTKALGDEIFKCWSSTPGPTLPACGGKLLCKPDIAFQGSSFCCKVGWFAEGGVCKPCVRTCDPAKEKLYLETCQCMCDVDKVSDTCAAFESADPIECRCRCSAGYSCPCKDDNECARCEQCDTTMGVCRPDPERPKLCGWSCYEPNCSCCDGFCCEANQHCCRQGRSYRTCYDSDRMNKFGDYCCPKGRKLCPDGSCTFPEYSC
jgi:hypothetical protein